MTIHDEHGRPLAKVLRHRRTTHADAVVLIEVDRPEALFKYYFGGGHRRAILETDEGRVLGRLGTRWQNSTRLWLVDLGGPA